ncbi:MAG: dTMP kinase [Elusimicrobia bacterium CG11_big_fil_rev_8_21_14_0_20_64_6]|nr:MAG: dTMP kinase [Elusimicrobia bacterium CG11_big_fil_rev_8_21_14_0_20_64_6]
MPRLKSLFIVFEGPDKSGKSTQARLLADALRAQGREVLHTREPGGTSVAEGVRKVLLDPALTIDPLAELFLYEASRAQHTNEKIVPALKAGKIVISERFTMSTDAYQGAARGLGLKTTTTLNRIATSGLKPDLTILLDIPVAEFDTRDQGRELDRLERENAEFRRKVREGYLKAAKADRRAVVLDGKLAADVLGKKILRLVVKKL